MFLSLLYKKGYDPDLALLTWIKSAFVVKALWKHETNPSGNMWIICLPRMTDELWSIDAGLTYFSETAYSLSYINLVRAPIQANKGICLYF